jgi:hypothetical protein
MPRVCVSSVVDAPAEKVWAIIRQFDACAEWLPFVRSSFREILVALSDAERSYSYNSYTFVGSPVPVRDHRTTLRVLPITDGDRSYVERSSRFEIAPEHDTQLVELMNRNFLAGLRSLAGRFRR